jgi:hypothetical protein
MSVTQSRQNPLIWTKVFRKSHATLPSISPHDQRKIGRVIGPGYGAQNGGNAQHSGRSERRSGRSEIRQKETLTKATKIDRDFANRMRLARISAGMNSADRLAGHTVGNMIRAKFANSHEGADRLWYEPFLDL